MSSAKDYLLLKPDRPNIDPLEYYVNGAFDVIQNPYYFSQENFFKKHETLFKRIGSPIHSIEKDGGFQKFFKDEFATTRVVPNLTLHLVGGGYDVRLMQEYFEDKGAEFPLAYAITFSYLAHFGNEALELTNHNITSHDNIADLFIFDIAAIYLFQNDDVVKFFRDTLSMNHWHSQPILELDQFNITNAGLNYIFRPDLFKANLRPFLYLGMQTLAGLSYEVEEKKFYTLAAGMALTDPLEQKGRFVVGMFYDKDDFLNASLFINGGEDYRFRLNLHPGFLKTKKLGQYGLLIGQKKDRDFVLGLKWKLPIGIGLKF